ncbi:hydroxymethylbilane synthase [Sphingomonas immobilis]|uniref:Porphobilinogen deaminase n=1 Tax=Sphingomonas immobilis TaxID=3063997 RepID=A0ABT8ZVF3_9SPHN|nr:hydroxymethylbilane synthase [Sphingomonas sp. CA1-15]MDO7841546.1 hydroxymethylbilane synthase [Sphingomonas sp. CA1-15]
MTSTFRLGTRGSPLALTQAAMVRAALCAAHGWREDAVEITVIRTTGDRVQDRALAEIGGKALWTKELDRALLDGAIDCAVHSMKDVETIRPAEIAIAAMLPRADVRDRLIGAESIAALRKGAVVGTSSPRRAAQLKRLRPDIATVVFRGNVDTRLAKLAAGEVDATLLAAAGLDRLGRGDTGVAIAPETMLPAPAQGAVGIETLTGSPAAALVAAIDHADTHACVLTERALLARLVADCHSPVAALATLAGGRMTLAAELLSEDGAEHVTGRIEGTRGEDLAETLATDLLARAPDAVRRLFAG